MHRYRAWGLAALAAAAGATAAAASDPPPRAARPTQTTVVDKLFGKARAKAEPATPPKAEAPPGLAPDVKAAALRDEQDAYERRMAVCLKVREVADQSGDENLHRQVDEMERRAAAVYHARVASLGLPPARPAEVLDRRLGTGVAVTPLTAPAPPVPAGPATAAARATAPTADRDVREVRP